MKLKECEEMNKYRDLAKGLKKLWNIVIGALGTVRKCVMVIVVGNGHGDTSSNPDCIPHSINTLGKGMNLIILPPAMGKIVGQTRFFSLGEATSLGEGKL